MEPQATHPDNQELEAAAKMIDWEKEISSTNFDCDWASCSSHPCHDECSQSNHTHGCGSSSFCDDLSVCMKEDCHEATCDSSCHSALDHCPSICVNEFDSGTVQSGMFENNVDGHQNSIHCPWLVQSAQCDAMVGTDKGAIRRHVFEQHIDPQWISRCPQESCPELIQKNNLPNHQAQQHQLDSFVCNTNDCFRTYPTSNDLLDHILASHGQLDCRYGGCEVSTSDPMQLKNHFDEYHLDQCASMWPDNAVFDRQYPSNGCVSCLASPDSMKNAVNYPSYIPDPTQHQAQYYGSNIPYPSAFEIDTTDYNQQTAASISLPHHCHHGTFADQVQTAWYASQPCGTGVKPGKDMQAMDEIDSAEASPATNTPSSKGDPQITGHVCQWTMDPDNNFLCNQAFDTAKALQDHLRRDHCTSYNAARPTTKASSICRWSGCSRNGEPLTDVHKLIRHALTHSNYRDYVCSYCEKACTTKGQLVIHERVHTGEKPIKCEFCSKTTSNESQMGKHEHDLDL
ncbi:MAG: hypothetical protein Q9215_008004 [Flavoplaca cf. flavocitrina]